MTHIVSLAVKEEKMGRKRGGEKNKKFYITINQKEVKR